jgi:hypothetical protein
MGEVNTRTNVDACVLKGAEHDRMHENHRKCLTDVLVLVNLSVLDFRIAQPEDRVDLTK